MPYVIQAPIGAPAANGAGPPMAFTPGQTAFNYGPRAFGAPASPSLPAVNFGTPPSAGGSQAPSVPSANFSLSSSPSSAY